MSTTPTTTLQIENNTFTIESDINSILVVNSSISLPSTTTTTTLPEQQQQQQQQMNSESNGYVKHLELELKKLKEQFDETKQENHLIKEYNTHLARKLEDKRRNKTESFNADEDDDDDADSIVTYVDVQNIANKIEYYLIETNKLFKTNVDLNDSMKYLIKNIWSLIAHEYNDKNLDQLKLVKDELVNKLQAPSTTKQKIDSSVNTDNTDTDTDTTSTDMISLNEIESLVTSYKIDAETLKDKLFKQNELIKELKQQFESSTSICKVNEPAEKKDSFSFSPGTSPSDLFLNSRLFNKYSVNTQTQNDDSIQTKETTTAAHQQLPPPPPIQNTSNQNENNVYYLHNLDDFVAIQTNNTYDASLLGNNNQQPQQQPQLQQQQQTNNELVNRDQDDLSTLTNTDETNNNIFLCPCCGSSFDSTIFEANDIFIKKFEKHVQNCDQANKLTCKIFIIFISTS